MDYKILLLAILLPLAVGELPSCYRARCSHCKVEFVAKMCPESCNSCPPANIASGPKIRVGRPNYVPNQNGVISNARVHGATITNNANTHVQQNVYPSTENGPAKKLRPPSAHQLPEENTYQAQYNAYQTVPQPQQSLPEQQVYTQYQPLPVQQQSTSFGSSYAQNANYQNGLQQQYGSQLPQQPSLFPQPQPAAPFGQPTQGQSTQFYNPQPNQNIPQNQPFNIFQPQGSPFLNPFQPFLQQPFQAQQQQNFQPLNPFAPAPVNPQQSLSQLPGQQTIGQLPPYRPQQYVPAAPQTQQIAPQQVQASLYTQEKNQPQQSQFPYASGQQPAQIAQRPTQVYNLQQLQPGQQAYAGQGLSAVLQQKAPSVASPSIDNFPVYINKNSYGEKSGGKYETCPKQPNWEPCIQKEVANERFRTCCQRLGEGCSQLCSYDQTLATIQIAVLTGRCPISKVADMMICASGNEDATPCCQAYNVFEPGFEHCRPYCNPAAGLPNDGMLAEKYRCLGKLSQIQRCFYVTQKP